MKIITLISLATVLLLNSYLVRADQQQLQAYLTELHLSHQFHGNVLIAKQGKVVFEQSYGIANFDSLSVHSPASIFSVASVTKQFTAAGILLLKQQRKLSLDQQVSTILTDFPYADVTVRHLLTHTSGLPTFWDNMSNDLDKTISNGNHEMYQMLLSGKYAKNAQPGDAWEYSDIGYDLLAMIIEEVSHSSYGEFLDKHIFKPLSMTNSFTGYTDVGKMSFNENIAIGYDYLADQKKYQPSHLLHDYVYYLGSFYGDGNLFTTSGDLLKWDQALYSDKILSQESIKQAYTPMKLTNGESTHYGFGWHISDDKLHGKVVKHAGGQPGYKALFQRFIDEELTMIFLANTQMKNFKEFRVKAVELYLN